MELYYGRDKNRKFDVSVRGIRQFRLVFDIAFRLNEIKYREFLKQKFHHNFLVCFCIFLFFIYSILLIQNVVLKINRNLRIPHTGTSKYDFYLILFVGFKLNIFTTFSLPE